MRLLSCVMALMLSGCALETALQPADDLSREPDYRAIVARSIGSVVGDPSKIGVVEISGARRAEAFKGPSWLVCLKAGAYAQPRYYAAYIQNEKLIESRLAVILDQCEQQSYAPFNEWNAAAQPVSAAAAAEHPPAKRGRR
jgi:hypothetical protein